MSSKQAGDDFEKTIIHQLHERGWWTYLTPSTVSGQPFDVIAIRRCLGVAMEIKHVAGHRFDLSRIEPNQRMALQDFMNRGNHAFFVLGNSEETYVAGAESILSIQEKSVDIRKYTRWTAWIST